MASILRIAAVAILATLALAGAAEARDRTISTDRSAANLSAFGRLLVWSETAANGSSRLMLRSVEAAEPVGVSSASGLFDADVGETSSGRVVAVYTRCAGVSGRNCDVYQFNFANKRESKVKGASSSRCSEFAPSIWRGTIAFGRSGSRRCNGLFVKGRRGSALRLDRRIPAETDIREGRVAYLHAPDSRRTYIRVFVIREGRSRVVIAGLRSQGERTRVTSPAFSGAYLYWLFEDQRRNEFTAGRSRAHAGSSLQFADRELPGRVESIALDGRSLYYSNGRGVFQATDPAPHFAARD